MNIAKAFFLTAGLLAIVACKREAAPTFYGKSFDTASAVSLQHLMEQLADTGRVEAVVGGLVSSVCQAEGCWLRLADEQGNEVFVDWNHEFSVPKYVSGRRAIIYGYAYRDTTSVESLRHLAQDAGKSAEEMAAITQPKVTVAFRAYGLWL